MIERLFNFILVRCCHWVSDEYYLRILYLFSMREFLHLNPPRTFSEKLQWLKIHDHKNLYTKLVDKIAVKEIVAKIIGEEYVIPTLGVWQNFDDIDFEQLPSQFVLKCNHNSGGVLVCKDKRNIDYRKVRTSFKKSLSSNYYWGTREYPYKNVVPQILAEKLIVTNQKELQDYKFMCFNGKVVCSFICSGRFSNDGLKVTFFDREWKKLPFMRKYPACDEVIPCPKNYEKMIELAEKIAKYIDNPFVRIDFYDTGERIYFGEVTFYPGSGMEYFKPKEWDKRLGDLIHLPL